MNRRTLCALTLVAAAGLITACPSASDLALDAGAAPRDDAAGADTPSPESRAPDAAPDGDAAADGASRDAPYDGPIYDAEPPPKLSQIGLYADIATHAVNSGVAEFEPKYKLWSDGAVKTRWVSLPAGSHIDTADMDHWSMPVGTKFFKEFKRDGLRVETRMIFRWGPGVDDFTYAAYAWNAAETEGDPAPGGVQNARGTAHDIPPTGHCVSCHGYLPEHILGFGAIELSHDLPGVSLKSLSDDGRLTVAAPPGGFIVPGGAVAEQAIGYLHANCSNCHNAAGIPFVNPFSLRVLVSQKTVADTSVWKTAVDVPVEKFNEPGVAKRITKGQPTASCVYFRPASRGDQAQMPPIATKVTDPDGLALLSTWITGL